MKKDRKGTLVKTRDGRWQAMVTLFDGTRKRLPPFEKGISEAYAREKTAYWQERVDREKIQRKRRTAADSSIDPCEKWVIQWISSMNPQSRRANDHKQHWHVHIRPVLGEKHIRDWSPDDLRRLVRSLDERIETGQLAQKTARNVWSTARRMCQDAASYRSGLCVRLDNPSRGIVGPRDVAEDSLCGVYFITTGDYVKIGFTGSGVDTRARDLQTASPFLVTVFGVAAGLTVRDERTIHRFFDRYRIRGEWFLWNDEVQRFASVAIEDPGAAMAEIGKPVRFTTKSEPEAEAAE